jgi:hypothetical protein
MRENERLRKYKIKRYGMAGGWWLVIAESYIETRLRGAVT